MTNDLHISRRDFLNGIALGSLAGSSLSPLELLAAARGAEAYPPALTGLRGAHVGSFEVAHALAWAGTSYLSPERLTDSVYDLVVVGAGLSGLAAALRFRQQAGEEARILIIDNHDDFGGHAKRNEFDVDGQKLIGYGGGQSIDTPGSYSPGARQILVDAGIDLERFYQYFDQDFYAAQKLDSAVYFSAAAYGRDVTAPAVTGWRHSDTDVSKAVNAYPIDAASKTSLLALLESKRNYLGDGSRDDNISRLRRMSYRDYLLNVVGVTNEVYLLLRDGSLGLWGIGYDALSALEGYRLGAPGFAGMDIGELPGDPHALDEPYIFHFPDGNAGVARALVHQLVPAAVPGSTMEDQVLARVNYGALDKAANPVRIRLNSTAVDVHHTRDQKHVDVCYVSGGKTCRVRGRHAIWAGYSAMVPYVCSELPAQQAEAIRYAAKVPLVYINIAVRSWRAFANLGYYHFTIPQPELMHSFGMDFPVSMGAYRFTSQPDQPTVLHANYFPTIPDRGLSEREQHEAGRRVLYELPYADMEKSIVAQLQGALGAGGFDAGRDIAAITVNRWPHGYAYEYNELSDPAGWGPEVGPHILGRAQVGRISFANSDSSAFAYVDGAFDAAIRAVNEQSKVSS
ncbi:MAG TPA: NAD(P)-binding protein [Woeseiaceae bacterium]|nr:NAD(P)-binding protein [Woeseiaceae bacterium]